MAGILSSVYHTFSSNWLIFNWHIQRYRSRDIFLIIFINITFMRLLLMQQIVYSNSRVFCHFWRLFSNRWPRWFHKQADESLCIFAIYLAVARATISGKGSAESGCARRSESLRFRVSTSLFFTNDNYNERKRESSWRHRPARFFPAKPARRSVSLCRATTDDVTQLLNPRIPPFPTAPSLNKERAIASWL